MVGIIAFIFIMFFCMFILAVVVGVSVIAVQIAVRIWSNKITPWIDEHFGETDW